MRKLLFVLFILSFNIHAEETYGRWVVKNINGMQIAKTSNDNNDILGYVCLEKSQKCAPYIVITNECSENQKTVFLMASELGSKAISADCQKLDGVYMQIFEEDDQDIFNAITNTTEVGFAMALNTGDFKSIKFKTYGANSAISKVKLDIARKNKKDTNLF